MNLYHKLNNKVIPVNKEKGITTFDAIRKLKRELGGGKIGHAGSLDPIATGLILILTGIATKLSGYLMDLPKVYISDIKLGEATDTQDAIGEVIERGDWEKISTGDIEEVLPRFTGKRMQMPPMYSALKHGGKPLYKLARKGKKVDRKAREVHTESIELLSADLPLFRIRVKCSRGLYLRTLSEEIGRSLGVPSHMTGLTRVSVGHFEIEEAISSREFDRLKEKEDPGINPAEALRHLKQVVMSGPQSADLLNGRAPAVPADAEVSVGELVCFLRPDGRLGGIGEIGPGRIARIRRVLIYE
jgi:tRNA pseudouridine55 synthase